MNREIEGSVRLPRNRLRMFVAASALGLGICKLKGVLP